MIDNPYVIKTYRYLRLAMVGLVIFLLFAVLIEWWHTAPRCFQTTLSAYYYTPAQGVFVSALLAIGICMVVLKGNTEIEDVLLNAAGMLAPIAALVPTPGVGDCWSTPVDAGNTAADVANNIAALLAISVVALAVVFIVADAARLATVVPGRLSAGRAAGVGLRRVVLPRTGQLPPRSALCVGDRPVRVDRGGGVDQRPALPAAGRRRSGGRKSVLDHRRVDGVVRASSSDCSPG